MEKNVQSTLGKIKQVRIFYLFNLIIALFMIIPSVNAQSQLLYLKQGDPSEWTETGVPGNQHEEISQWTSQGYTVQTMNLTTTTITSTLLAGYQVLRFNGEGGVRNISTAEGNAIYNWVVSGGKLLADVSWTKHVPAVSSFGVQTIDGLNGGSTGLDWYFHGAPMLDGPVMGPEGGVDLFSSSAMDKPILTSGSTLIVDYYKSGYPMIVHNQFGIGRVVIVFSNAWSHDEDWPGNAYRANIFEADNLQFLQNVIEYFNTNLLYLKQGDPSEWTITGVPGNQHEEISQWTSHGYLVQTMNLTTTTITSSLLSNYEVLRLNDEIGVRNISQAEGNAIYNWVLQGGKFLADIAFTKHVPAVSPFGVETIIGANGGGSGLDWYFNGAPMVDGPITGPMDGVQSFASSAMDRPVLSNNSTLIVDYYKGGYPMIVHNQFGAGKAVIVFTIAWSHDQDWPGNAYQANIFEEDNLEYLQKIILYFQTYTGIDDQSGHSGTKISLQGYPNPFVNDTKIKFHLSHPDMVSIAILDISGKEVAKVCQNQNFNEGDQEVNIDGVNLKPGIYLVELMTNEFKGIGKVVKISR
jgi:hypothetical protein